jgi:cellulose synthase/poly-beta-1,6-N-acetylglucosamine synthase-like glycosyltransferase
MIGILNWLLLALLALVFIPTFLLLVQVMSALLPRRTKPPPNIASPRLAVVVPAHNESIGVRVALDSVMPQLRPGDRLIVVADNCSDDTVQIAHAAGAEVVERHDTSHRGKGYALDFGVRYLEPDPPQVVVIVDADCKVMPGTIDRIARLSCSSGRPVQALYLMKSPQRASAMMPIKEFAWAVKNLVRPLGFHQLDLPCQLTGTGMAFPWPSISKAALASGHIVEDLKLGLELARAGTAPLFCPDALVTSVFPMSADGSRAQQTRWEHGHLGMVFGEAPRYFVDAVRGMNLALLALTLDMCIPPLALLTLAILGLCIAGLSYSILAANAGPLVVAVLLMLCLAITVFVAWARFGRQILPMRLLLCVPIYALAKIPLYVRFFVRRQVEWVRSKRDAP